MSPVLRIATVIFAAMLAAGCGREAVPAAAPKADARRKVVLQTDWFPQAEHGGFYQALAKGYYAEAGLAVTLISGGPGSSGTMKVCSATNSSRVMSFSEDRKALGLRRPE